MNYNICSTSCTKSLIIVINTHDINDMDGTRDSDGTDDIYMESMISKIMMLSMASMMRGRIW